MAVRSTFSHTISGVFTPADSKKFFAHVVPVPEGALALDIIFKWEPEVLDDESRSRELIIRKLAAYREHFTVLDFDEFDRPELASEQIKELVRQAVPLKNLLNLSLYDPHGNFRGRWDRRYFGGRARISSVAAAGGFYTGPIIAGEWTVVIDAHLVVTRRCAYRLEIEIETKTSASAAGKATEKTTGAGKETGKIWYKGELHLHTNHSDGVAPLSELISEAERAGLDFIALTDHNTTSSHAEISRGGWGLNNGDGVLVIPGMEFTTFFGHAVALGITDYIDWRMESPEGFNEKIRAVHDQGGLFQVAHPFSIGDPLCSGCEWMYDDVDYHQVDLLEVWSGSWSGNHWPNRLALRLWERLLNKGMRVTAVAARDVHKPEDLHHPADCANTYIQASSRSVGEILEGLRQGRVYISRGPTLGFTAERTWRGRDGFERKAGSGHGRPAIFSMGDTIHVVKGEKLKFHLSVDGRDAGVDGCFTVNLVGNGRVIATTAQKDPGGHDCRDGGDGSGCLEVDFEHEIDERSWFRCDVYAHFSGESRAPDRLAAIGNPIFVELWPG